MLRIEKKGISEIWVPEEGVFLRYEGENERKEETEKAEKLGKRVLE